MKNLLKLAVVALALFCSQAYGHPVCSPTVINREARVAVMALEDKLDQPPKSGHLRPFNSSKASCQLFLNRV